MANLPLGKTPIGFLGLIRGRSLGTGPIEWSQTVLPTIDVSDFYGADILLNTTGAPTIGALANLSEQVVATAAFRIHHLSAQLIVGAAAVTNLQLDYGINIQGTEITIGGTFIAQANAGAIVSHGSKCRGIIVPQGATLVARANGTAGGADHSLRVVGLIEALFSV